jgi:hypothetical protein
MRGQVYCPANFHVEFFTSSVRNFALQNVASACLTTGNSLEERGQNKITAVTTGMGRKQLLMRLFYRA